jgi:hypothetical protein
MTKSVTPYRRRRGSRLAVYQQISLKSSQFVSTCDGGLHAPFDHPARLRQALVVTGS